MAQIVDARPAVRRERAQADRLNDLAEVPLRCPDACTPAAVGPKERAAARMGDGPVTEPLVFLQLRDHAPGDRNDAASPVLAAPDGKGGVPGIEVPVIETDRLADPQAGDRHQAEQGRAGRAAQPRR